MITEVCQKGQGLKHGQENKNEQTAHVAGKK